MSIADKLTQIAKNEQKVYDAGKIVVLKDSKHMNAMTSGAVIAVNDVNYIEHDVVVKVASKNLLDNNTDKLALQFDHPNYGYYIHLPAGPYTVHAESLVDSFSEYLYHQALDENGNSIVQIGANYNSPVVGELLNTVTFTINVDFIYRLYCAAGGENLDRTKKAFNKFNIQLERGGTATQYTPYVEDLSQVNVKRYGKNLFENNTDKVSSISFTNKNGTISSQYYGYAVPLSVGTYTIHAEGTKEDDFVYSVLNTVDGKYMQNVNFVVGESLPTITFAPTEDCVLYIYNAGAGNNNINTGKNVLKKYNIQLEVGNTATPYTQYVEPTTHMANADGTVKGVKSLSAMTLVSDMDGVTITCQYLRDIDTYINNLLVDIALTGGN